MRYRTSFTKENVFVVLICVVFLMGSLGAVGDGGRRRAKDAVCASNLHRWGVVFETFLGDNDRKFMSGYEWAEIMEKPSGYPGEGAIDNGGDHSWPLILQPYYKNRKLLCCPTASRPPAGIGEVPVRIGSIFSTWRVWLYYPDDYFYGSYGINSWVYNRDDDPERWRQLPVRQAHNVPLFLDCYWCEGYPQHYNQPPAWPLYAEFGDSTSHMKRFCLNRHGAATNVLFLDFSVRKVGLKQLWRLKWHREWPEDFPLPVWPPWMENFKDP